MGNKMADVSARSKPVISLNLPQHYSLSFTKSCYDSGAGDIDARLQIQTTELILFSFHPELTYLQRSVLRCLQ